MRQQSASYEFANHGSGASPTYGGMGAPPHNNASFSNTIGSQANNSGVTYATIGGGVGTSSSSGLVFGCDWLSVFGILFYLEVRQLPSIEYDNIW